MDINTSEIFMRAIIGASGSALIGFIIYIFKAMRKNIINQKNIQEYMKDLAIEIVNIQTEQKKQEEERKNHVDQMNNVFSLLENLTVLILSSLYLNINCERSRGLDIGFIAIFGKIQEDCKELGLNGSTITMFKEIEKKLEMTRKKRQRE